MNVRKKIVCGVFVIVASTLFLMNRTIFFRAGLFEKISTVITYPFIWTSGQCAEYLKKIVARRVGYKELVKQHTQLQKECDELTKKIITLQATARFNAASKEILDFQERYNLENAVLARILLKELSPEGNWIIINRGSHHQIKKDMVAIYKLQILGKVIETHPYHSKILLLTDKACQIAAFTNSTSAQGIVQGTNNPGLCTLSYITNLSKIEIGDLVFSSGTGLIFPEGFCLGKIIKHEIKKNDPYHSIELEPLVDIKNISYCLITDSSKINLF